jgi:hypothetical protein
MAVIAIQTIDLTGLAEFTLAAASASTDTFVNDGRTILVVNNASGSQMTVTIDSLQASDFGSDEDIAVAVEAGERVFIGPFQKARFNSIAGVVTVTTSLETSVTVAALQLHAQGW